MRISDWSSDVCSSDLRRKKEKGQWLTPDTRAIPTGNGPRWAGPVQTAPPTPKATACSSIHDPARPMQATPRPAHQPSSTSRSEEHTSELQSLMRISYAVFCLKQKKT